jgi:G3E family GTPase
MDDLPVTVVGGYLGSGKTTWINHRLRRTDAVRYAVMVNDFGALNVDAALVAERSARTIELTNGCVCCSISGDMAAAAEALAEQSHRLDWVLLEASGVADLSRLKQQVEHWPGFRFHDALTLADATRIRELATDKFVGAHVRTQLREAEQVRLTHLDRIAAASLESVEHWLATLRGRDAAERTPPPRFSSDSIPGDRFADRAALAAWLDAQAAGMQRIKGFVSFCDGPPHLLQWVRGEWALTPWPETTDVDLRLVRIAVADA